MAEYRDVYGGPFVCEFTEDVSREEYDNLRGLNPSTIVHRRKSALHAKHAYEQEWKDTPSKKIGRASHSLLLEPKTFFDNWCVWTGGRRYGKSWDEFRTWAGEKEIISQGELTEVQASVTSALKKPEVQELVKSGVAESVVQVEECGLQCKGRMDWIDTDSGTLCDPKFVNDIAAVPFGRSAAAFGYHIKMALYKHWFEKATGKQIKRVVLITIETSPPYDVAVVPLIELHLESGLSQGLALITQIAADIRNNSFPGVDGGDPVYALDLPMWALDEDVV